MLRRGSINGGNSPPTPTNKLFNNSNTVINRNTRVTRKPSIIIYSLTITAIILAGFLVRYAYIRQQHTAINSIQASEGNGDRQQTDSSILDLSKLMGTRKVAADAAAGGSMEFSANGGMLAIPQINVTVVDFSAEPIQISDLSADGESTEQKVIAQDIEEQNDIHSDHVRFSSDDALFKKTLHELYHKGKEAPADSCAWNFGFDLFESYKGKAISLTENRSDTHIQCYAMSIPDMPSSTYPQTFCEARNVVVDFSRLILAEKLVHRPHFSTGKEATLFRYEKGAIAGNCSLNKDYSLKLFQADHMKDIFDSLKCFKNIFPEAIEKGVTLLVSREKREHRNVFHATTDFMNAFAMVELFDVPPEDTQVVLMDVHSPSVLDAMWNIVFSLKQKTRKGQWFGRKKVLFERLIFSPPGYSNLIYSKLHKKQACSEKSNLITGFSDYVLKRFGIEYVVDLSSRKQLKVLLIVRRPHYPERISISRQFMNEDDIMDGIRAQAENSKVSIELSMVDFAEISTLRDQLLMTSDADIIIGMHGAGLTHLLWLPEHAGVVELHPSPTQGWYCFAHMAEMKGLLYASWDNPKKKARRTHGASGDRTAIDVEALQNILADLFPKVLSRKYKMNSQLAG